MSHLKSDCDFDLILIVIFVYGLLILNKGNSQYDCDLIVIFVCNTCLNKSGKKCWKKMV